MTNRVRTVLSPLVLVFALVLGACSGDDSAAPDTTGGAPVDGVEQTDPPSNGGSNGDTNGDNGEPDSTDPTVEEPATIPPSVPSAVISVAVSPGTGEGFEGARADIDDLECRLDGDRWVVGGTVTNPLDVPASYRIYTSFLDGDRYTVGLLEVNVDGVGPDETRDWSGELAVTEPDLDCILRVERTRLGS